MAQALPTTTASIPDDLKSYVRAVTAYEPGFNAILTSLLSPAAIAALEPAVSYVVAFENVSNAPLRGIGVAFIQQPASGPARVDRFSSINTFSPTLLWSAGEYRLYVPHTGLYNAMQQRGAPGQGVRLPSVPGLTVVSVAAELATYSTITASVSYVITEQGKLMGPDPVNDFDAIQAQQHARRDLAAKVQSHGTDQAGLVADLQTIVKTRNSSVIPGRDHYSSELRARAQSLLNNILHGQSGSTYVADFLARTAGEINLTK